MSWHERHGKNENLVNFLAGSTRGIHLGHSLQPSGYRQNQVECPRNSSPSLRLGRATRENQNKYTHFSDAIRTIWKVGGLSEGLYAGSHGGEMCGIFGTNVVALPSSFHSLFFPSFSSLAKKKCL